MEIDYSIIQLENIELKPREAVKIRGFFAEIYRDNILVHNHKANKVIYGYPKIQYKVLNSIPTICGIEEGVNIIKDIGNHVDFININNEIIEIFQKKIKLSKQYFGIADDYISYELLTPWMALNQNNIGKYDCYNEIKKEELLKRILIGNILSIAKGLNYNVEENIHVWTNFQECIVNFKNIKMRAFRGKFKTNFIIPDYLGIGKSVARGFGTIKRSG